jgi:hypothetical protein
VPPELGASLAAIPVLRRAIPLRSMLRRAREAGELVIRKF